MRKVSIDLPKHRLHLQLKVVKRRAHLREEPIIPSLKIIKRYRAGGYVSRFFRHIFAHKNIKRVLGTNLALMLIASSFMPAKTAGYIEAEETVIVEQKVLLTTEKSSQYPVKEIKITQGYRLFHPGIDLDGLTGDPIYPIKPGKVEAVSYSRFAYGNAVIIDHGNQITSLYAHLSEIDVEPGQQVGFDTVIGKMGATGRSFGDHLHLEIRDHGRAINPFLVLPR